MSSLVGCPDRTGTGSTTAGGPEFLQYSWGGDETILEEAQPEAQAEQLEESVHKNLVENIDNKTALPAEGETGAAPSAVIVEPEGDRSGEIKDNIEP